jgi:hypothetical protein
MNPIAPAAYEQSSEEAEERIIEAAKAAVAQENLNKSEIGRLASEWTQKHADGRTDADFAELVGGLTRSQVTQRRLIYQAFGEVCYASNKLTWTHHREALDWDDAEEWLAEANENGWSVATMKQKRAGAVVDAQAVDSTADVTFDADACDSVTDSAGKPAFVPVPAKKKPQQQEAPEEPKPTEVERLHCNVGIHVRSTVASLQRDFVDADMLLVRHRKPGFARDAAIELTKQLNVVLQDLQRRVDQCR